MQGQRPAAESDLWAVLHCPETLARTGGFVGGRPGKHLPLDGVEQHALRVAEERVGEGGAFRRGRLAANQDQWFFENAGTE